MPDLRAVAAFALATFILTVIPGPGVLYVVGRSVGGGRRSGFASMLGIETGEAVYVAGAALGITALLAASPVALSVLRYGGAAYLALLGIHAWRHAGHDEEPDAIPSPRGHWGSYGRGMVVQLLNPKVAVFFLAYFPQFIRATESIAPQVLVLAGIYLAIAVATDACYVLAASWLADRLARSDRARRHRGRISAVTYLVLAAAALTFGDRGTAVRAIGAAA